MRIVREKMEMARLYHVTLVPNVSSILESRNLVPAEYRIPFGELRKKRREDRARGGFDEEGTRLGVHFFTNKAAALSVARPYALRPARGAVLEFEVPEEGKVMRHFVAEWGAEVAFIPKKLSLRFLRAIYAPKSAHKRLQPKIEAHAFPSVRAVRLEKI